MCKDSPTDEEFAWFSGILRLSRPDRQNLLADSESGLHPLSDAQLGLLREDLNNDSSQRLLDSNVLNGLLQESLARDVNQGDVAPEQTLPEGTRIDHYRIELLIDVGGMGGVYLAEDTAVGRKVALKLLMRGSVDRFEQETQTAAALEHPSIVRLYGTGYFESLPYYVMEYVSGETLQAKIDKATDSGLPPHEAAKLIAEVARAVAYAHSQKVLHRDLKPSNIFISEDGKPRIGDFGLARFIDRDSILTRTGDVFGSPAYMAPEQTLGNDQETSPATDVYGLGATLYACLVGRPPFQGEPYWEVFELVKSSDPVPPSRLEAGIPPDLETICLKCLEKDPNERYSSAAALSQELQRFLRNEPIEARPLGSIEKFKRWCIRRPAVAALALAAMLLLTSLGGWGGREIYNQRQINAKLSENLVANAELLSQQGKWREALAKLIEAENLGSFHSAKIQLLRIEALIAVSETDAYFAEIDRLGRMRLSPNEQAQFHLLRALSLMASNDSAAAQAECRAALQGDNLPLGKRALAEAILAETSEEVIAALRNAIDGDPTSHFAQQYLGSLLILLGRYDEVDELCRVARVLFPESPAFPMLQLLSASGRGDEQLKQKLLESPELLQLDSESLDEFVAAISAFELLQHSATQGFDLDITREEFLRMREDLSPQVAPFVERLSKLAFHRVDGLTHSSGFGEQLGMPTFQRAYEAFGDVVSLRTFGFLLTGKGSVERIDQIAVDLNEAFRIHPDGFFQLCRGRLLFARNRLEQATEAYEMAYSSPSIFPRVRRDAAYGVARCYLERWEQSDAKNTDYLEAANEFGRMRFADSKLNIMKAKYLLRIAKLSRDYDFGLELLPAITEGVERSIQQARLAYACNRVEECAEICNQILEDSPTNSDAQQLLADAENRLEERLRKLRSVERKVRSDTASRSKPVKD